MEAHRFGEVPISPLIERPASSGLHLVNDELADSEAQSAAYDLAAFRAEDPLWGLTDKQAEVAKLAIDGLSYEGIGSELNISTATVRTHLSAVYSILDVSDKAQLAGLMPAGDLKDEQLALLSGREREIFEFIAFGKTIKQTAAKLYLSVSTVRTHHIKIREKLGGLKNQVELTRVARLYGARIVDAATTTQSAAAMLLDNVDRTAKLDNLKSHKGRHPINNSVLLSTLCEHGYISDSMRASGKVGLRGLIAALLLKKEGIRTIMSHPETEDIAREVIENEVRVFHARQSQVLPGSDDSTIQ